MGTRKKATIVDVVAPPTLDVSLILDYALEEPPQARHEYGDKGSVVISIVSMSGPSGCAVVQVTGPLPAIGKWLVDEYTAGDVVGAYELITEATAVSGRCESCADPVKKQELVRLCEDCSYEVISQED